LLQKLLILLFILFGAFHGLYGQIPEPERIASSQKVLVSPISRSDTLITLPHHFLIGGSERLYLDTGRALKAGKDYALNPVKGTLTLHKSLLVELLADSARHSLVIEYRYVPFSLKPEYSLFISTPGPDTSVRKEFQRSITPGALIAEDVFGSGLQRSGSILRGLTVGSNRDLTLNSGFRLQLSGKVASGLDLTAALTDENVPIQPEGTTQALRELDKVFVQLRNPSFAATLGDFVYDISEQGGGDFGRFSRKLQGASGTAKLENLLGGGSQLEVSLAAASTRGKYMTNQFQGIEGNQGPYRLSGEDPSRRPIIIAGTEKVYVNGQLMTRGEANDYTIDYSTGEVFFSPRRMVTSATRISIDFQYTDRQFVRNLVGTSVRFGALDNSLVVSTTVTQEADDDQSPIEQALDDTLRGIIASSGSNRFLASISGTRFVGRDSITSAPRGQYILKDTILAGRRRPMLVYAPGDPLALYSSVFALVDRMPSDSLGYRKTAAGGFTVAGLGEGEYLPLQFLPVPELRRMANGRAEYNPTSAITLSAEYAVSEQNLNRLAPGGSTVSQGAAYKFQAGFHPADIVIGGVNLGVLQLRLGHRFVDGRFVAMDRFNDVEFGRLWNIETAGAGDEKLDEASLSYDPHQRVHLGGSYGLLERKGSVRSTKWTFDAAYTDSTAAHASIASEFLDTRDFLQGGNSVWTRQRANLSYQIWRFRPAFRIEAEDRQLRSVTGDSLRPGSFRFVEIAPGMALLNADPFLVSAEIQFRTEDSSTHGTLRRAFRAVTQFYDFRLKEWNSLSSSASLSLRTMDLTDDFALPGSANTNTILVRSQTRFNPLKRMIDLDLLYEFARERSAPMKRVFIRVPRATGNYIYKGDTNNNGLPDESEFEQTRFEGDYIAIYLPDDQLVPVSDVKLGARLRLTPNRLLSQSVGSLAKVFSALSTETVLRLEERGTDEDPANLYLLRLSRFQNDATTISGTRLFTQDVHLFEADPSFSLRLRFSEKQSLLRLVGNSERGFLRERSLRIRAQVLRELGNQTDIIDKIDRLSTLAQSPRQRNLASTELRTEFSYRPYSEWEVAFGTSLSQISNQQRGDRMEANLNDQFVRLTYSVISGGQLRSEIQREEAQAGVGATSSSAEYPYEFTAGRVIGKTYQWRLAFDYRISQYVQVSVGYDGRSEGSRAAVHTGRAEAKAFF